jgi:hypothetical protein
VIYSYIRILKTLNEATFNSQNLNARFSIVRKSTISSQNNTTMLNVMINEDNSPSTSNNVDKTLLNNSVNNNRKNSEINTRDSFTRSSLRSQRAHKTVMKMLCKGV